MIPIVIYARYSSHAQTELSIEGQLRDCRAFAAQHEFQVVGEYTSSDQIRKPFLFFVKQDAFAVLFPR